MARQTFFCIDGHTCGNPVRLVACGAPALAGVTMLDRRADFISRFDWIRTALMFEPRGHDMMSGAILYPPTRDDCDAGILFIETSGCLPMCGHGTIGAVTLALEQGLITPAREGLVRLDAPAGVVEAQYMRDGVHIDRVRIVNVPSFLFASGVEVDVRELGRLAVDIAYGGNFYAIVDCQDNFRDIADVQPSDLIRWSPRLRTAVNAACPAVHPENPTIAGVSHILWTGRPTQPGAQARNAVFYGDRALDRSPCGTGTSARMAQWVAQGRLAVGDSFVHESIIGSTFTGRVERRAAVGPYPAIIPSVEGWARMTGYNTIFVDDRDPYAHGFQLADRPARARLQPAGQSVAERA